MAFLLKLVKRIEGVSLPVSIWVLWAFFVTIIRHVLESFSSFLSPSSFDVFILVHFSFFYYVFAFSFALIVYFLIKERIEKVIKVVFIFLPLIWLAPIFDMLFSSHFDSGIGYVPVREDMNLWQLFISFWAHNMERLPGGLSMGVTRGVKLELIVIFFFLFLYVFLKTRSWWRSLSTVFLSYCVLFAFSVLPSLVNNFCQWLKIPYLHRLEWFSLFYLDFFLILGGLILFIYNKEKFKQFFGGVSFFRIAYYLILFGSGFVLAFSFFVKTNSDPSGGNNNFFDFLFYLKLVSASFSIFLACLFAVVNNNVYDQETDEISNPQRPLVRGVFSLKVYQIIGNFLLVFSLLLAYLVDFSFFLLLAGFEASYFLYSSPPLRGKRLFLLSKMFIAGASLFIFLAGFLLSGASFNDFPHSFVYLFLGLFLFPLNFIDLKDYEGDKKAKIYTLPVILGMRTAQKVIGVCFFLSYLAFPFVLGVKGNFSLLLGVSLLFGLLMYGVVNKKKYSDSLVLGVFLVTFLVLGSIVVLFG